MTHFWDTGFTIPAGMGFSLFGAGHFAWLVLWGALCAVLGAFYRRWNDRKRLTCRRVLAALLLLDELFKVVSTTATGRFRPDFLPLHLCSINIFLILWDAIRPSESLWEILTRSACPARFSPCFFPAGRICPCGTACVSTALPPIFCCSFIRSC